METVGDWFARVASIVGATLVVYTLVLLGIRVVGRRTLSQMSAFDFIVTIAIGTLVGTAAAGQLLRGSVVILTLLVIQQVLGYLRRKIPWIRRLVDFRPLVLVRDGAVQEGAMHGGPQMTREDLASKLRQHGVASPEEVALAILESTGELSVLRTPEQARESDVG